MLSEGGGPGGGEGGGLLSLLFGSPNTLTSVILAQSLRELPVTVIFVLVGSFSH